MQRVDGTLQRTKCAFCFQLQEPFECAMRKGSMHLWSIVQKGGRLERAYQLKRRRLKPDVFTLFHLVLRISLAVLLLPFACRFVF